MYRNLGHKLKTIAKIEFWVILAASAGAGAWLLFFAEMGLEFAGALLMVLSPLLGWLCSLLLYVLGHLVENSDMRTDMALRRFQQMSNSQRTPQQPPAYPQEQPAYAGAQPAQPYAPEQGAQEAPAQPSPYYGGSPYAQPGASPYYDR
ncbi:MAG: hypothetical protein IJK28_01595 [Clostridia bacterium]|nr:hypothetical protein [Clostridia bacterium]